MKCTKECLKPNRVQAHCPTCHRTFGGIVGFKDHRKRGSCLDPATLKYHTDKRGVWRSNKPHPFSKQSGSTTDGTESPGGTQVHPQEI